MSTPHLTIETIPAPHATRAYPDSVAVDAGTPVTRIIWHDSPCGLLHFTWQYLDAAFAALVAAKLAADPKLTASLSVVNNWRSPHSGGFTTSARKTF